MICEHNNFKEKYKFDSSSLFECENCKLIFTDKCRKDFDPKTLYGDFYKNEIAAGRFKFGIEFAIKLFRFFRAFKIFTVYPQAKSTLDIGSGRGFALYYLKKYYKYQRTAGTQISKVAYEFSKNKLGLEIYNKDLLELSLNNNSFDIITIWHVLEHVAKPEEYIKKIFNLLKNDGKLLIEVPNFNSWTRILAGKYWLGLDLDYHIHYFTAESLSNLIKKYNFKIKFIHTFSLEYSTFISVQSFVSLLTRSNHLFFQSLQTGKFGLWIIFHAFIFILLAPICFLINVLLYFSNKGEVLCIVAEKD